MRTERKKLWAARKGAFGAIGRIAPDSMIQDAVVPRSRLPEVLDGAFALPRNISCASPTSFMRATAICIRLICFDSRLPDEVQRQRSRP